MRRTHQYAPVFGRLAVCYVVMGVLFLFKEGDWTMLVIACAALAALSGHAQDEAVFTDNPLPAARPKPRSKRERPRCRS